MKSNSLSRSTRLLLIVGLCVAGVIRLAAAPTAPPISDLLAAYAKTADALATDDLVAAKSAAAVLAYKADIVDEFKIARQASVITKATDLSAARDAFKMVSALTEPLAAGVEGYVVMTCSMANADWVQPAGHVKNPYLGKAMPTCGERKTIAATPAHGCGDTAPDEAHSGHGQHDCG